MEENKIIEAVLQNREDIQNIKNEMMTRKDHEEIMDTLDILLKLAKKNDEEMTMMSHASSRQQEEIESIKKDVQTIKPLVGLA